MTGIHPLPSICLRTESLSPRHISSLPIAGTIPCEIVPPDRAPGRLVIIFALGDCHGLRPWDVFVALEPIAEIFDRIKVGPARDVRDLAASKEPRHRAAEVGGGFAGFQILLTCWTGVSWLVHQIDTNFIRLPPPRGRALGELRLWFRKNFNSSMSHPPNLRTDCPKERITNGIIDRVVHGLHNVGEHLTAYDFTDVQTTGRWCKPCLPEAAGNESVVDLVEYEFHLVSPIMLRSADNCWEVIPLVHRGQFALRSESASRC